MKPELEQKLYEKYPKIFRQKDLTPQETCMYQGIAVGDGWYNILDKLCAKIQNYVDEGNTDQVEAFQVKKKIASLRFYVNSGDKTVYKFIEEAELESTKTCEFCGATENIGYTTGWPRICCETCAKELGREWKKNETSNLG